MGVSGCPSVGCRCRPSGGGTLGRVVGECFLLFRQIASARSELFPIPDWFPARSVSVGRRQTQFQPERAWNPKAATAG